MYDSWGKLISITGTLASTIGASNPFRYRGYYYDAETGLFYVGSRYYDPTTGRFLNADSTVDSGTGIIGTNMFAHCLNNPVNMYDDDGQKPKYLSNSKLLFAQNVSYLTRAKAVYTSFSCLNKIYKYSAAIASAASKFNIPINMIRAVLYRELMCFGIEDLLADQAVRNKYQGRYLCVKRNDSSTGLAQIFAATAIRAEKAVLGYNTTTSIWTMWRKLQDPATNIYYCGMVLRMEANALGYTDIGMYDYSEIQAIFARYNGSSSYGVAVLGNYKEFMKG